MTGNRCNQSPGSKHGKAGGQQTKSNQ